MAAQSSLATLRSIHLEASCVVMICSILWTRGKRILGWGLIEFQIRNTLEMAHIVREHRQVVKDCRSTNEDIKVRDHLSTAAKKRTDFGKPFHDRLVKIKDGKRGKELSKGLQVGLGIGIAKCDIIDFPYGDVADGNFFWIDAFMGKNGFSTACKHLDNPISVE